MQNVLFIEQGLKKTKKKIKLNKVEDFAEFF